MNGLNMNSNRKMVQRAPCLYVEPSKFPWFFFRIIHTWLGGGGGAPGFRTDPLEEEKGAGLALGGVSEGVEFCKGE